MIKAKEEGFTLIEMIAVIMLVGIISTVLGFAIVQGAKSYVFARANVSISQKAQLAVSRMERELREMTDIDPSSAADSIRYKRETASSDCRAIEWRNGNLEMSVSGDAACTSFAGWTVLIDDVENFTLQYENDAALSATPPLMENLRAIHMDLTLRRPDSNREENFNFIINPRNSGRLNAPGNNG